MDNLKIYDAVRSVPPEALKIIGAGRLKGKSDINPMWRIKALTEQFGACGVGWKYDIVKMWLEQGGNSEISAFTHINLYIKNGEEWSEAIPGIGGSSFVSAEKNGLYTSDECYKMALTDAISVACKALGVAADVYWSSDKSKYDKQECMSAKEIDKLRQSIQEMACNYVNNDADKLTKLYQALCKVDNIVQVPADSLTAVSDAIKKAIAKKEAKSNG